MSGVFQGAVSIFFGTFRVQYTFLLLFSEDISIKLALIATYTFSCISSFLRFYQIVPSSIFVLILDHTIVENIVGFFACYHVLKYVLPFWNKIYTVLFCRRNSLRHSILNFILLYGYCNCHIL